MIIYESPDIHYSNLHWSEAICKLQDWQLYVCIVFSGTRSTRSILFESVEKPITALNSFPIMSLVHYQRELC